jgi:DNA-binding NarL/FixJ family response regulator
VIYDAELTILSVSAGIASFFAGWADLGAPGPDGVPPAASEFVRTVLAGREPGEPAGIGLLRPTLLVDAVELEDEGCRYVVASFDRFAVRDPIGAAAGRYHLTGRERDVVALLLSGLGASAVARRLNLSETTVHGYFKRLRQKTGARTLSGMIATLLGWSADALF